MSNNRLIWRLRTCSARLHTANVVNANSWSYCFKNKRLFFLKSKSTEHILSDEITCAGSWCCNAATKSCCPLNRFGSLHNEPNANTYRANLSKSTGFPWWRSNIDRISISICLTDSRFSRFSIICTWSSLSVKSWAPDNWRISQFLLNRLDNHKYSRIFLPPWPKSPYAYHFPIHNRSIVSPSAKPMHAGCHRFHVYRAQPSRLSRGRAESAALTAAQTHQSESLRSGHDRQKWRACMLIFRCSIRVGRSQRMNKQKM